MTDSRPGDLDYGRLGEVNYDSENKIWSSERSLRPAGPLKAQGSFETYVSAPLAPTTRRSIKAASRLKDVRRLMQIHPEMQAGASVVYEYLSEALLAPDQLGGYSNELLAFGDAQYADRSASGRARSRLRPVVAIPGGSHREKLIIIEMKYFKEGWRTNRDVSLQCPDLSNTAKGLWDGDGGHIRQICFAPMGSSAYTLLVVRTVTSIHILRPLFLPGFVGVKHLQTLQMPSHADAECVDVAFNPEDPKKLVAVDSKGSFVIWNIQEGYVHCEVTLTLKSQTRPVNSLDLTAQTFFLDDGWRRALWIADHDVLLLCSRRRLECYSITTGRFLGDGDSLIEERGRYCSIADMRRMPTQSGDILLATTVNLIWLRINVSDARVSFETMLSWKHHRDINDLSLRVSYLRRTNDLRVMLYSRRDTLITEYCLANSVTSSPPTFQGAPTRCEWHGNGLQDLHFIEIKLSRGREHAKVPFSARVNYWQAIALHSDLSLSGRRFHDQPARKGTIAPPSWRSNVTDTVGSPPPDSVEFFIDDLESESGIDNPKSVARTQSRFDRLGLSSSALEAALTVPNEVVFDAICDMAERDTTELVDTIERVTQILQRTDEHSVLKLDLLNFYASKPLEVSDLDAAFTAASKLVQRFKHKSLDDNSGLSFGPLASPHSLGLPESVWKGSFPAVNLLYRRLLSTYSKYLASDVRGKARLNQEMVVRRVAGAIFLASIGAQKPPSQLRLDNLAPWTNSSNNFLSASSQSQTTQLSSSFAKDSTGSLPDPLAESVHRLANYAQIAPPPHADGMTTRGQAAMIEILGHWTLHADPIYYSYGESNAALSGVRAIRGSALSAEAREDVDKQRRKAEIAEQRRRAREQLKQSHATRDAKRRKLDFPVAGSQSQSRPMTQTQSQSQLHSLPSSIATASTGRSQKQEHIYGSSQGRNYSSQQGSSQSQPQGAASQTYPDSHGGRSLPSRSQGVRLPFLGARPPKKKPGF